MALIWLPVLYALAVVGCPCRASRSPGGMDSATRAAMRYPRWPLMLALLLLLVIGSFIAMDLQPLLYYPPRAHRLCTLLCVLITFLLMTMVAVAYRDRAGASHDLPFRFLLAVLAADAGAAAVLLVIGSFIRPATAAVLPHRRAHRLWRGRHAAVRTDHLLADDHGRGGLP